MLRESQRGGQTSKLSEFASAALHAAATNAAAAAVAAAAAAAGARGRVCVSW